MTTKEIYESIDQSKISPKGKDFLQKAEKSTKGFTIENEKLETVMRKIYKDLKERKPEALKNVKVKTVEVTEKVPTTKSERKKEPKKTTKTVKRKVKKASGTKKNPKPTKTPSTPKEGKKEHISTRASKLAKKEGITFKEARAKISKLVKEESKKAEKQTEKELDKLLAFVRKESFEGEEKYPKTYGKQKPDSANLSQDAKRRAKPVGKRVSKNGKTYYEYRDNRSDRNSLPAPKGQYRYKGKTPPFLEAGGTLPTQFGQAGLVGETGAMNEMDLFAMGGGLPQGVHQYYANTYNPAYPTPHGYAKGGYVDIIKITEPRSGKRTEKQVTRKDTYREALKEVDRLNAKNKNPDVKFVTGNIYAKGGMVEYAIFEDYDGNDIKKMKFPKPIMESKVVEPMGYSLADIDEDEDGVLYARFQQEDEFAKGGEIDAFIMSYVKGVPEENTNLRVDTQNLTAKLKKGGKLGFDALSKKVAKRYEGKAVPKKFQSEYGKRYSKAEAQEVGDKVASKVYREQQGMAKGGVMKTYDDFGKDYDAFTDYVMDRISLEERRKIRKQWEQSKSKMQWQDYLLKEVNKKSMAKGGQIIEYSKVYEILESKIEDAVADLYSTYENSEQAEGKEVEYESRDGFIPFTNGGYSSKWFEYSNQLEGSGINLPTKSLEDKIDEFRENNREYGFERFEQEYPEIVKQLGGIDNVSYSELDDAGYSSEADDLDMFMQDDDDSIMMEVEAYYYNPNNDRGEDGKHTIQLSGVVNLEAPYHRSGNLEDYIEERFTFDSYKELEDKLDKGLAKVVSWFEGDMYDKNPRELKIRRMEAGGKINSVHAVHIKDNMSLLNASKKYSNVKMDKPPLGSVVGQTYVMIEGKKQNLFVGDKYLAKNKQIIEVYKPSKGLYMRMESGGTLPTPFGQAGLVGETGAMNEMDLFAMGGGLPQGVHQYYANTYNPAYPTPHGYAKGGKLENNTFANVLKKYGFKEQKSVMGVRIFYNPKKDIYASVDNKNRLVEVFEDNDIVSDDMIQYSGYSVIELIKFLSKNKFAKGGMITSAPEYHEVRNAEYKRRVKSGKIKDTDDNFRKFDDMYFDELVEKGRIDPDNYFAKGGEVEGGAFDLSMKEKSEMYKYLDKGDFTEEKFMNKFGKNEPQTADIIYYWAESRGFNTPQSKRLHKAQMKQMGYAKGGEITSKMYDPEINYQVVVNDDYDSPLYFKTFASAKKYTLANVKNQDNTIISPQGDSIEVEKNQSKKDLDFLFEYSMAKGGKTQGYNDKLDESLGNTKGKRSTKEQNYKDRRNESEAMEKKGGKRKYARVKTMDKGTRKKRKTPMTLAKAIRRDGEKWQDAVKRATIMMKKEK